MAGQPMKEDALSYRPLREDTDSEGGTTDDTFSSYHANKSWDEGRNPWRHSGVITAITLPCIISLLLFAALIHQSLRCQTNANLCAQILYCKNTRLT